MLLLSVHGIRQVDVPEWNMAVHCVSIYVDPTHPYHIPHNHRHRYMPWHHIHCMHTSRIPPFGSSYGHKVDVQSGACKHDDDVGDNAVEVLRLLRNSHPTVDGRQSSWPCVCTYTCSSLGSVLSRTYMLRALTRSPRSEWEGANTIGNWRSRARDGQHTLAIVAQRDALMCAQWTHLRREPSMCLSGHADTRSAALTRCPCRRDKWIRNDGITAIELNYSRMIMDVSRMAGPVGDGGHVHRIAYLLYKSAAPNSGRSFRLAACCSTVTRRERQNNKNRSQWRMRRRECLTASL